MEHRAQRNFTDGDSRIMPSGGGFIAGYNGQIAVDAAHQIIVAHRLATNPADYAALLALVDQARADLGRQLREVSGDSGFATEANLAGLAERRVRAYLSPGRIRHGETDPTAGRVLKRKPLMQAMANTIRAAGRQSRYRLRKQVVEPVFGQIKYARGFGSSSSAVWPRSEANGRCSAPHTTSSSSTGQRRKIAQPSQRRQNQKTIALAIILGQALESVSATLNRKRDSATRV